MGYAVLLYFDDKTEQSILALRHVLTKQGVETSIDKSGKRPHVSLAGFSDVTNSDLLILLVQEYAKNLKSFDVRFDSFGVFPSTESVLFLSPTPTIQLLTYHKEFHQKLSRNKFVSSLYYVPENWMPHCTVKMNIPEEQLAKAAEACGKNFKPIQGQFQEIGVVEYFPVKSLETWSIAAK